MIRPAVLASILSDLSCGLAIIDMHQLSRVAQCSFNTSTMRKVTTVTKVTFKQQSSHSNIQHAFSIISKHWRGHTHTRGSSSAERFIVATVRSWSRRVCIYTVYISPLIEGFVAPHVLAASPRYSSSLPCSEPRRDLHRRAPRLGSVSLRIQSSMALDQAGSRRALVCNSVDAAQIRGTRARTLRSRFSPPNLRVISSSSSSSFSPPNLRVTHAHHRPRARARRIGARLVIAPPPLCPPPREPVDAPGVPRARATLPASRVRQEETCRPSGVGAD